MENLIKQVETYFDSLSKRRKVQIERISLTLGTILFLFILPALGRFVSEFLPTLTEKIEASNVVTLGFSVLGFCSILVVLACIMILGGIVIGLISAYGWLMALDIDESKEAKHERRLREAHELVDKSFKEMKDNNLI